MIGSTEPQDLRETSVVRQRVSRELVRVEAALDGYRPIVTSCHSKASSMNAIELVITSAGCVRCVYNESIDLAKLGAWMFAVVHTLNQTSYGQWTADLSPVGGPS